MSAKNKVRGNAAETYIRERCEAHGVPCERAWASDGRSMGLDYTDDGTIGWFRWQSKRFKFENVVKWFIKNAVDYLQGKQHVVTFYVDKGKGHPRTVYTIMELEEWLRLKRMAIEYGKKNAVPEDDRRA